MMSFFDMRSTLKEKNLLIAEQILSFKSRRATSSFQNLIPAVKEGKNGRVASL